MKQTVIKSKKYNVDGFTFVGKLKTYGHNGIDGTPTECAWEISQYSRKKENPNAGTWTSNRFPFAQWEHARQQAEDKFHASPAAQLALPWSM